MRLATSRGFSPNERTAITGLAGLTLTSATGAKFQLMPIAVSSSPLIAAAVSASAWLRPAPSAMLPGSWVAGGPIRATMPPSWSMPISEGMAASWASAASWMPLESPAIWGGFCTLLVQAK